jgi:hypothetical protein
MSNYLKIAFTVLFVMPMLGFLPAIAQQSEEAESLSLPAPRLENGRINLGPLPGESGMWMRNTSNLVINPDSYEARATRDSPIHIEDVPIQPWALALTNYRHDIFLASEPYTRCKPSGGPRQIMSPYGFEIVDMPELERVYLFTVSNAMSYRIIYMDGREHPQNLKPSYIGHSIGQWDGDTLLVDTVGMNERAWMSRDGLPHTDQLHLIERFTRTTLDTMEYEVLIDDPGAYTEPWISGFSVGWTEDEEMYEYVCQENNLSPEAMLGEGGISRIAP